MPFERSYIFLDTAIYVQEGYRFQENSLGKLAHLSHDDELKLVVPEIIKKEVAYKLREAAEEHVSKLERAADSNIIGLISESDRKRLRLDIKLDKDAVVASIGETWNFYCTRCNAASVPLSSINLQEVVTSYFDGNPPFQKGRKRHEFPDAFAVSSLRAFAMQASGRPIYVVSKDKGLLEAFSNDSRYLCREDLSEILDDYNRHTEAMSPAAHKLVEQNANWIGEVISEELQAQPHLYAPQYRDDRIHIERVTVDLEGVSLVEIGLDRALFGIGVAYHVEAQVQDMIPLAYDDYDWDIIPRYFDGTMTAYVEILSNEQFNELIEIASVEF